MGSESERVVRGPYISVAALDLSGSNHLCDCVFQQYMSAVARALMTAEHAMKITGIIRTANQVRFESRLFGRLAEKSSQRPSPLQVLSVQFFRLV